MRVSNLKSPRSGNEVANQYVITDGGIETFQSYSTVIAKVDTTVRPTVTTLDKDSWDYSVTTLKYLKEFLKDNGYYGLSKKDIQDKIDSGEFKTEDLN